MRSLTESGSKKSTAVSLWDRNTYVSPMVKRASAPPSAAAVLPASIASAAKSTATGATRSGKGCGDGGLPPPAAAAAVATGCCFAVGAAAAARAGRVLLRAVRRASRSAAARTRLAVDCTEAAV